MYTHESAERALRETLDAPDTIFQRIGNTMRAANESTRHWRRLIAAGGLILGAYGVAIIAENASDQPNTIEIPTAETTTHVDMECYEREMAALHPEDRTAAEKVQATEICKRTVLVDALETGDR